MLNELLKIEFPTECDIVIQLIDRGRHHFGIRHGTHSPGIRFL